MRVALVQTEAVAKFCLFVSFSKFILLVAELRGRDMYLTLITEQSGVARGLRPFEGPKVWYLSQVPACSEEL